VGFVLELIEEVTGVAAGAMQKHDQGGGADLRL